MYNFQARKELLKTSYLCKLSEQEMAKDKAKSSCPCWLCMAKGHVKECPPAKPEMQTIEVKTVFLNLEKDKNKSKDKNKTNAATTMKDQ